MTQQHDDANYAVEVSAFRQQKDEFFARSPQSPIPHAERHQGFHGLTYFAPDAAFRVRAQVVPFAQPEIVELATSTGDVRPQLRYAELRFQLGDRDLRLTGFAEPHQHHTHELFVPFQDATSGHDTYGAGRYLEVEVAHAADGTESAIVDFNYAYSPYCAYNIDYSCPVPPAENRLPVAVLAGERNYSSDH